jgi:hypothetical protein
MLKSNDDSGERSLVPSTPLRDVSNRNETMKLLLAVFLIFVSCICRAKDSDCDRPSTTLEINACAAKGRDAANLLLGKYLASAKNRYAGDKAVVQSIDKGQTAWRSYRQAQCDSVYEMYRDGSIRDSMYLGCELELTNERTHHVWKDYLTFWDSTPPVLPEPTK